MKTNITIVIITISIVIAIVVWVKIYKKNNPSTVPNAISWSNVVVTNNKQEITVIASAWQGYIPRVTTAKAWIPTTLKLQAKNSYWCESAVRIPQLSYSKNLDPNWSDIVNLWEQKAWAILNGTCAMGMYNFQIKFE